MSLKEKIENMVWTYIGKPSKDMVLATVDGNAAAARTVSFVPHDGKLYFCTDSASDKSRQMRANPDVALCVDGLRIKGTAKILGHPFHKESEALYAVLAPSMPWLGHYKDAPDTVFVEVTPTQFKTIEMRDNKPVELVLNVITGEAHEVVY